MSPGLKAVLEEQHGETVWYSGPELDWVAVPHGPNKALLGGSEMC